MPGSLDAAAVMTSPRSGRTGVGAARRVRSAAAGILVLAALAGCAETTQYAPADTQSDSLAEILDVLWSFESLGAGNDPTVVITDPPNNQYIPLGVPVTSVTITFTALNWAWPQDDHAVNVYLDDVLQDQVFAGSTSVIPDVPKGYHVVAVVLAAYVNGQWVEYGNAEARDTIVIKIQSYCLSDMDQTTCDDGIPCSIEACVPQGDGIYKCGYGPKTINGKSCCVSRYECSPGWLCSGNLCVQCQNDAECDDDNKCTADTCQAGLCSNVKDPDCCVGDADCGDGLFCTIDSCDLANEKCLHINNGDPTCCETEPDPKCDDANFCTIDKCIAHECRHGPVADPECCNINTDCDDGNPCTADSCDVVEHLCMHLQDPNMSGCCTVHTDCGTGGEWDDQDPSTIDYCKDFLCQHVLNPSYCDDTGAFPCLPDMNPCTVDECVANSCQHNVTPGCCLSDKGCVDTDVCTVDTCVLQGQTGTCAHTKVAPPKCCNYDTDCDDGNLCNLDKCINHICRFGPDPALPDCCQVDLECNDNCACTDDYCDASHTCQHTLLTQNCCYSAAGCDDGDPYTVDSCKSCVCVHDASPVVCNQYYTSCDDKNPCTVDTCDLVLGLCKHTFIPGCCSNDLDPVCNDFKACTLDKCNLATHTCAHTQVANCCAQDSDCDDGKLCTTDACVAKSCKHVAVSGCCVTKDDCQSGNPCYVGSCNAQHKCIYTVDLFNPDYDCCGTEQDCFDNKPCTNDYCVSYQCKHSDVQGCCVAGDEVPGGLCDDKNPCTWDKCVFGICRNLSADLAPPDANIPSTCCVKDDDCASDGNPCTTDSCNVDTGLCQYIPLDKCYLDLPYTQQFATCSEPGGLAALGFDVIDDHGSTAANWKCSASGGLGPDTFARFGWVPEVAPFGSFLTTPWLSMAGQTYVTVQFDREYLHYSGSVGLGLFATADGTFGDAVPLWTQSVTADLPAATVSYGVPASMLTKPGIRLGFYAGSDTTWNVDSFSIDGIRVCAGHGPAYVEQVPTQMLTWTQSKTLKLKAADSDGAESLTFELIEAPSFVKLGALSYNVVTKTRMADVTIQPTGAQDMGTHKVRARVSDGCLYADITFSVTVLLSGGYAVWQPSGTSDVFAQTLRDAIVAAGRQAQVVTDLAPFGDLMSLSGVFVPAGVYGNKHVLLESDVAKIAQYAAKGGKVYLEGGDTWYVDPATSLHSYFKIAGVSGGEQSLTETQLGLHFCHGLEFLPSSDYEVNNFLDVISETPGGIPLLGWTGTTLYPAAVAYQDATLKYRTIGASVPFAVLVDNAGNTTDLMDRYLDFFENGWPACLGNLYCNDSRPCTQDTCGADKKCVNAAIADCVECSDDSDCADDEACKTSGAVNDLICQEIPGARFDSTDTPKPIDTVAGNATVSSTLAVANPSKVISASIKLYVTHAWRGDIAIKLEHATKSVQLKLQDPTDKTLNAYVTYEFGIPTEPAGGMAKFNNLPAAGDWKLTITDTVPGFHSGNLVRWSLFLVTEDGYCGGGKSCDDGDICTADSCYYDWCTHKAVDCTDLGPDGNPDLCTVDSCDADAGCIHTAKACDDGNPCTKNECDVATGSCLNPPELNCTAPCVTHKDCGLYDYCDPETGTCKPIPGQAYLSDDTFPVTIPDSDPVWAKSQIKVSGQGIILDAYVKVMFTHPYIGDLVVTLTNGTKTLYLHKQGGGAADDLYKVYDIDAPAGPGNMGAFDGLIGGGTWTLAAQDWTTGDTGTLDNWILFLNLVECQDDLDCDDSSLCTVDTCKPTANGGKICEHTPFACDDGLYCNGTEQCDPKTGCKAGVSPALDDKVACTADFCDESQDLVVHTPSNEKCSDGKWCTGTETCDALLGCQAGVPVAVDDGNACTVDLCDETIQQVTHLADDSLCDDDLWCNGTEQCNYILGCIEGIPPVSDDGIDCTVESCNEALDAIVHSPDNAACTDGLFCNGAETCHASKGCQAGKAPSVDDSIECTSDSCDESLDKVVHLPDNTQCADDNPCTDDSCDPASGCKNTANVASCDDGNMCTVGDKCQAGTCASGSNTCPCNSPSDCPDDADKCNGQFVCAGGFCVLDPATAVVCPAAKNGGCLKSVCDKATGQCAYKAAAMGTACDDGNLCTTGGKCDNAGLCVEAPKACDDGLWCNGNEGCSPTLGCTPGIPPAIDDKVACTADYCDEDINVVFHTPVHAACGDNQFCNGTEVCDTTAGCKAGPALSLSDGIDCTLDTCNESVDAIVHTPVDTFCTDSLYCNGPETCKAGIGCIAGDKTFLDDGIGCTVDSCDEATDKVSHTPVHGLCDDANKCNGQETCDATLGCKSGQPTVLTDGIACTADACDPATGTVTHTAKNDLCDNGKWCDGVETCEVSLGCQPGKVPAVDDGVFCTQDACDETLDKVDHIPDHSLCADDEPLCTDDICVAGVGCVIVNNSDPCNYGGFSDNGIPLFDCTLNDVCKDGKCTAGNADPECWCDKDQPCPQDGNFCNGSLICVNNKCVIDPASVVECNASQDTACKKNECDPVTGLCSVQTHEDGTLCDDKNACTQGTTCTAGSCGGGLPVPCSDGVWCNGTESCDPVAGCKAGVVPVTDDGIACTLDLCDEANDQVVHKVQHFLCDDGKYCNGAELCSKSLGCLAGTAPVVNDGISCTTDSCDEVADAVVHVPDNSACSDGLYCNGAEVCDTAKGCKAGKALVLDDGIACTEDTCDEPSDQVKHTPKNAQCDDGKYCNGAEYCDAGGGCKSGLAPLVDDGIACTFDSCDESLDKVVHLGDDQLCSDAFFCNGTEKCDKTLGCVTVAVSGLDDGIGCTVDTCDEDLDKVSHTANHTYCSDALYCNGKEVCNTSAGCQPGAAPTDDDGITCTLDVCDEPTLTFIHQPQHSLCKDLNPCTTDFCQAGSGCIHSNNAAACDDGEICTTGDACADGKCVGGAPSPLPQCACLIDADCPDDGNKCNGKLVCQANKCVVLAGSVVTCPDLGEQCKEGVCNPLTGLCQATSKPTGTVCNDGNLCTTGEVCDASGQCKGTKSPCDDGLFCNGTEACDPAIGLCQSGPLPLLTDGIACTKDYCDELTDSIKHTPDSTYCDDGQYCNGTESCSALLGCQLGAAPPLSDGVPCTKDYCDDTLDSVVHLPEDKACDDGLFCNGTEKCDATEGCKEGAVPVVSDGIACTADACSETSKAVTHTPDHAVCSNGNPCDGQEWCSPDSGCTAGLDPDLDDGVGCTIDTCDPQGGFLHLPDSGYCDDGLYCNGSETCDALLGCISGAAPKTPDTVACTIDYCDEDANQVIHLPAHDACDDGLYCNGSESCDPAAGCIDGAIPTCDDSSPCTTDICNPALNGGKGACDASEVVQYCDAACGGDHAFDAGDDLCGYDDACVGGTAGAGKGTCSPICDEPDCIKASAQGPVSIGDKSCETVTFQLGGGLNYVDMVQLKLAIEHFRLSDLEITLTDPSGTSVIIWNNGGGLNQNFDNTFTLSYPNTSGNMCAFKGHAASGTWTLEVCDEYSGSTGILDAATLYVHTTSEIAVAGDTCSDAIVIPAQEGTQVFQGETTCAAKNHTSTCGGADAPDRVYKVTVPWTSFVVAKLGPDSFNQILYAKPLLNGTCDEKTEACSNSCGVGDCAETVKVYLEAGTTMYLFVDGAQGGAGLYTLQVTISKGKLNGEPCDENKDCISGHCENGYCCDSGVCCSVTLDCPNTFNGPSVCVDDPKCQGERKEKACTNFTCVSNAIPDDSGCNNLLADACGAYLDKICTAAVDQIAPKCPNTCASDAECDADGHCDKVCELDYEDGSQCDEDSDCKSSHCSGGFCCQKGDCCETAANCPAMYTESNVCDDPGTCQGHDSSAVCWNYMCGKSSLSNDSGCTAKTLADGCGHFKDLYCNGQADQAAPVCPTACTLDSQCDADSHCDDVCQPDVPDGWACDEHSDCISSHCQNGFCCASGDCCDLVGSCPAGYVSPPACDSPNTCQGHSQNAACLNFICLSSPVEDDSACGEDILADGCGLYIGIYCKGTSDQSVPKCLTACAFDGQCDGVAHCDNSKCELDLADGSVCDENSDCISNHCQNGFCCASGDCCSKATNCPPDYTLVAVCELPSDCQGRRFEPACSQSICGSTPVDDDTGCTAAVLAKDCGYFKNIYCDGKVNQSSPVCPTTCKKDTDCDPGAYCEAGVCKGKQPDGTICDDPADCQSGFCADGYCCNSACTGLCKACNLPGVLGKCTPHAVDSDPENDCPTCYACDGITSCVLVQAGKDPAGDCAGFDQSTCKQTGQCSGFGTCSLWPKNTECNPLKCEGHVLYQKDLCDGAGTCVDAGSSDCSPYICKPDGLGCLSSCVDTADCVAGWTCVGGVCVNKGPNGQPCTSGVQCLSGFCADGYCCNSPCAASCQSCAVPGLLGTCAFLPANTDPNGDCLNCQVCDGSGACKNVAAGDDPAGDCSATLQATCGLDGTCDGLGTCRNWLSGTVCKDQSCAAGVQDNADLCNGKGACVDGGTTLCHPYVCNGTFGCFTNCFSDEQCAADAWCDGTECVVGKPNGKPCSDASQCLSGFCADGYCCDTACTGVCASCAINPGTCTAQPTGTDPGTECGFCQACTGAYACGPAATGTDPHNECSSQAQTTCGTDGSCDGAGACRKWPAGIVCAAQNCSGAQLSLADTCDGAGVCVDGGSIACSPYVCNSLGSACLASCETDDQCVTGYWCSAGSCVSKNGNGTPCNGSNECKSGFCVDGFCCNEACGGLCRTCAQNPGTCVFVSGGLDPAGECGLCQACNGAGACGNATAGTDPGGDCADDGISTCLQDGTCNGTGICRLYVPGSICQAQACSGETLHTADSCNGTGLCVDSGTSSCAPYVCNALGTACRTECTENAHCVADHYCLNKACVPKKGNGAPCGDAGECISSFCVTGVCCNAPCGGVCQSCVEVGKVGTCSQAANGTDPSKQCGPCKVCNGAGACSIVPAGADPKDDCAATLVSTCSTVGTCDGSGNCALWGAGMFCKDPACEGHLKMQASQCDGLGVCLAGSSVDCSPYNCNPAGTDCRTFCIQHADCVAGYYCNPEHKCVPLMDVGEPCAGDAECQSGFCVDGYCCDGPCGGVCESCGIVGSEGTCSLFAPDIDPASECGACKVCDGSGTCKPVPADADPKEDCAGTPASACGLDGWCNGTGSCRVWASGTVCMQQSCVADVVYVADQCDGKGVCADAGTKLCKPYHCDATGTDCLNGCEDDGDCQAAYYCLGNTCVAKKANGETCTQIKECLSGFCVDGYCCDKGCTGACRSCSIVAGTCKLQTPGSDPEGDCGGCKVCDVSGACVSAPSGTDPKGDCEASAPTTCGQDGTCDGTGICARWVSGTVCQVQQCAGGVVAYADHCDGIGSCVDGGSAVCKPFACDPATDGCFGSCTLDSQCDPAFWCDIDSTCKPKKPNGDACTGASQCNSGFCVDGYCCDTDCTGLCRSCSQAGLLGVCTLFANSTDPASECGKCAVCNGAGPATRPPPAPTPRTSVQPRPPAPAPRTESATAPACAVSGTRRPSARPRAASATHSILPTSATAAASARIPEPRTALRTPAMPSGRTVASPVWPTSIA